jgi:hypothetical protein
MRCCSAARFLVAPSSFIGDNHMHRKNEWTANAVKTFNAVQITLAKHFNQIVDHGLNVTTREIEGDKPSDEQLRYFRTIFTRVPRSMRYRVAAKSGRIELITGHDVRRHPHFAIHHEPMAGCASWLEMFAVVAIDNGDFSERTLLHEFAHLWAATARDKIFSDWLPIWSSDCWRGVVPQFANQREKYGEYFAECFALFFLGPDTRDTLTQPVRDFLKSIERN